MTKKKDFFPKYYSRARPNTTKNRLLQPIFLNCDGFYYLFYKNIKCWEINRKNNLLRLKTLINNDFLLNGFQIFP